MDSSFSRQVAVAALVLFVAIADAAPQAPGGRGRGFPAGPPSGAQMFQQNCATCHAGDSATAGAQRGDIAAPDSVRQAPSMSVLRALPPQRIYQAITIGSMAGHAATLRDRQKRDLTEFIAGRPFVDVEGTGVARMTNRCTTNPSLGDLVDIPSWNGWSPDGRNARFQHAAGAGLTAATVPALKLKWAFGLPGGGVSMSQPTVALGRVFVGSDNRVVYSLDAKSGCAYWAFHAESGGRFAPMVGPIEGHPAAKYAVFFVTESGAAYAVNAHDGTLLWKSEVKGLHAVKASSTLHAGRIYVPLAGTESLTGGNPAYECCRSRGGVAALDASSGRILWKVDTIAEPLRQLGTAPSGKPIWGPSGASVWNTPTVDARRRRIYVGTGNNYGPVTTDTSDAILALNMDDGRVVWRHQEFSNDSFMVGCGRTSPKGGSCPETLGPDWDFGGSSAMLQTLPDGRDVLVAAGKGGVAIALDPDNGGRLLWRTTLYDKQPPSALGLVLFGGASDGARAYYPLQQPGGGLVALALDTGAVAWKARLQTDPRGQSGAASAIPGVVFTGAWDGVVRAVDGEGQVIWSYNTRQEFQTINGVPAQGGSLGAPGPTIASGMVYLASGYIGVQNGTPGNVVLAFAAE